MLACGCAHVRSERRKCWHRQETRQEVYQRPEEGFSGGNGVLLGVGEGGIPDSERHGEAYISLGGSPGRGRILKVSQSGKRRQAEILSLRKRVDFRMRFLPGRLHLNDAKGVIYEIPDEGLEMSPRGTGIDSSSVPSQPTVVP